MEDIESELENKSIEREETPDAEPKKRTKKERSPAQIAAFEKAKIKRAENIALKKQAKAQQIKEPAPQDTEAKKIIDIWKNIVDEEQPPRKPIKTQSTRKQTIKSVDDYHDYQEPRQPIINNYYYGTNNHDAAPPKPERQKRGRKKKVEIVESSSDSESDDDEDYTPPAPKKQIQRKQTPPLCSRSERELTPERPKLQYNFV